jgi:hypothetical protein
MDSARRDEQTAYLNDPAHIGQMVSQRVNMPKTRILKLKRIRRTILRHLDSVGWSWNKGLSDCLDSLDSILFGMRNEELTR